MKEEIIIAGFGGQGVLSMGKILAYAGMTSGMEVSWMPAYGPEQRGGTANVTVILSESRTAIILNQQSLNKFESQVKPGGILLYDPHGIKNPPTRTDIQIFKVKAMEATYEMDNIKSYNMIVLGAYVKVKPVVTMEGILKGLKKSLPPRHHHLLPMNEAALIKGGEIVE